MTPDGGRFPLKQNNRKHLTPILRTLVEMGFIIFLFYSNLLMGEYEKSNAAQGKGLVFALRDIVTPANFAVAVLSALVGHVIFEYFRKKL